MGKNRNTTYSSPVENYRKQIGKQDYQKSKAELKEAKAKAQTKRGYADTLLDITVMLVFISALLAAVYAGLYFYFDIKRDLVTNEL